MAAAAQPRNGAAGGSKSLTKQQVLELQDRFIALYSKEDFQEQLREAWARAAGDAKLQDKARQDIVLPLQGPVLEQFGFDGSRAGVLQVLSAFGPLESDPEVAANNRKLTYLTNPGFAAKASANAAPKAPASTTAPPSTASTSAASSSPPSRSAESLPASSPAESHESARKSAEEPAARPPAHRGSMQETKSVAKAADGDVNQSIPIPPLRKYSAPDNDPGDGDLWVVVGGGSAGGIIARSGQDVHSKELKIRLQTGARVEGLDLVGERLHYRRLRGDGPDFGWVSLSVKGTPLLVKLDREDFQSGWSGLHGGVRFGRS